ncbi:MAG: hypothetical protein IK118_07795 [Clostridia bacterium]|nr:hypothetical protein [Clostridia bacterium]
MGKASSIKSFDEGFLNEIIKEFAAKGRVFTNEAQFQFELGYEIQKRLDNGESRARVLFEVFSGITENGKKEYTDLVISFPNGNKVAIELKYKSAGKRTANNDNIGCAFIYKDKKFGDQLVFPQGAENEGSYLFLKDVYRLENLLRNDATYKKAFAIIMTNSSAYCDEHGDTGWNSFELNNNNAFLTNHQEMQWTDNKHHNWDSFSLSGEYTCNWENYIENHAFPIKYMIWEINP